MIVLILVLTYFVDFAFGLWAGTTFWREDPKDDTR